MKRRKLLLTLTMVALVLALAVSACARKADYHNGYSGGSAAEYKSYDVASDSGTATPHEVDSEQGLLNGGLNTISDKPGLTEDKIIKTYYLTIETMDFDNLISRIGSEISRLDGYVEDSNISGKRYYGGGARYGTITARVPSDRVDEFITVVGDSANVIHSQASSKNVSLEYIDTESRIKALKIEQERLYAILEKELKLENIITLESRLSDIRYELQSYESKLRYFDNQVAYSTVTMDIHEVEKLSPSVELKQSVGTRIKNGLSNTLYNITEGFKNFIVWFVVNLPYILIWGVIIAIIIIIIRRFIRKRAPYRYMTSGESVGSINNKSKKSNSKVKEMDLTEENYNNIDVDETGENSDDDRQ